MNVPTTSYIVILDREGVIRYVGVGGDQQLGDVLNEVVSAGEGTG